MKNVERAEKLVGIHAEIGDKEGTYEQNNVGDLGNQTVYIGNQAKSKGKIQEKTKTKQSETIIFND